MEETMIKFYYKIINIIKAESNSTSETSKFSSESEFEWYRNGLLHREDGPALKMLDRLDPVTTTGGVHYCWYNNGMMHRVGGPAVISSDGSTEWFFNDNWHREGGPAIEYADGKKYWYKHGREVSPY